MFGSWGKSKPSSKSTMRARKTKGKKGSTLQKQGGAKKQFTTRHLAALDFLTNIPMKSEMKIRERGLLMAKRAQIFDAGNEDEDGELKRFTLLQQQRQLQALQFIDEPGALNVDAVGTKLQGPPAPTVRVPQTFRYKTGLLSDQAAVVRGWEESILRRNARNPYSILQSRVFVSRARAYPMSCFSVIGYDKDKEQARIDRQKADDLKGIEVYELPSRDWRGLSYKPLFKAISEDYAYETGYMHDPNEIDDPDMLHASNKFTAQRSAATGPVISSVTLFVNEQSLKNELNEQFREGHSNLPPSLTLSKIRNLKRSALLGCLHLGLEVSTVAIAVISMERLIMKGLVTKTNRRLSMGVCLLLAFKLNETLTSTNHLSDLARLLDFIDQEWHVSRKELFEAEFGAYVHLNFSLHVPAAHLFVVYNRLLRLVNLSSGAYLGEHMLSVYAEDIRTIETGKATEREQRRRLREEEEEKRAKAEAEQQQQQQEDEEEEDDGAREDEDDEEVYEEEEDDDEEEEDEDEDEEEVSGDDEGTSGAEDEHQAEADSKEETGASSSIGSRRRSQHDKNKRGGGLSLSSGLTRVVSFSDFSASSSTRRNSNV